AAEEPLEEKAGATGPPRVWQGFDDATGRVDEAPGKSAQALDRPSGQERRIPGEQLIGSIAAEGDGHRLPGVACEVDGGKERGIGERLVEQGPHAPQERLRIGGGERELMMLGAQVLGHHAGECFFVVGRLRDTDREGLELTPRRYGERGGRDRARIDAPAEEDSHGDVTHETISYR